MNAQAYPQTEPLSSAAAHPGTKLKVPGLPGSKVPDVFGMSSMISLRTWSLRQGVLFGEMAGLLGVSAMAEALTRDPTQMQLVKERGQVIFRWTDEDNTKETVLSLKNLGVDGVIYDRMDQNRTDAAFVAEGR